MKQITIQLTATIGLVIIVLTIWSIVIIPEFEKLPLDYSFYMEHDGEDQIIETVDGELSDIFKLRESTSQKVISYHGDTLEILSEIKGVRLDTDELVFESTKTYHVDRITLLHTDKEQQYFGFKPGVESKNYEFFHPLIFSPAVLVFEGESIVKDLDVFKFSVKTEKNDISFVFPQFAPNVIWSDTETTFWVEPITGEVVKFKRTWEDYFVVDGVKTKTMQLGGKETTQYSTSILVEVAKAQINYVNFYKIFIPLFMAFVIIGISASLILRKKLIDTRVKMIEKEKSIVTRQLISIDNLIESCNSLNPENLEPLRIGVSDEFEGIKSSINNMIERIFHNEEQLHEFKIAITEQNQEIEFQNRELAKQLTKNAEAERRKEEFLSMMTHEFKTPLTPIISWVDILLSNAFGELNEKQAGALDKIKKNSLKLLGLITDVLDAHKIDLNEMTFNKSKTSTKEITSSLIESYGAIMTKQKIKFIFSDIDDISLNTDKNRVEQVLRVFVTNSLDFVPETGGEIEIKVNQEQNYVKFYVRDNGIGVPLGNQSKLFQKFYQIDPSVTRKHGGSGLGLSVAKGIADGLGGEIGVISKGKGSEFFIKIPIDHNILENKVTS